MALNDERLKALPYLDYLKWMEDRIKSLSYSKGSSNAYWEAREIIRHIIKRYIKENGLTEENYHDHETGNMLRINEFDLEDYTKYAKTDKAKAEVIAQFKSDMDSDLSRLIYEVENEQQ
jgi:hypothetical protein